MKTIQTITLSTFLLLGAVSCNQQAPKETEDSMNDSQQEQTDLQSLKAEIQKKENNLADAENNKNIDDALSYYSDDIISYPPKKEARKGKQALRDHYQEMNAKDTSHATVSFNTIDVMKEGDMVVETGSWTVNNRNNESTNHGIYMAVFKMENGEYRCVREIWNSDMAKMEKSEETTE